MNKFPKRKRRRCELHACLKHILRLCRWSGHFPVENLNNPGVMRFELKSAYMVYYVYTWIVLIFRTISCIARYFTIEKISFADLPSDIVVLSALVVTALMYRLAKHWPALIQDATDTEQNIASLVQVSHRTHVKCTMLAYFVIILGFVEHILFTNFKFQIEVFCSDKQELDVEVLDTFLKKYYYAVFDFIPFIRWFGVLAEFMKLQDSFMWNITDIIGMCFSIYLSSYFRALGKIIRSDKPKNWSKIRACYSRLAIMLNMINGQLAPFILLTSFSNLFFICRQLFHSLHKDKVDFQIPDCENNLEATGLGMAYIVYYIFSLLFLIFRSMGFVYLATDVHTSANKAVLPLYEVPSSEYNEEVECFQMQLRFTRVGLSGIFFYVERQTILRVIAIIITYELVLLQFSLPKKPLNVDYATNITLQLYRGIF